MVITVPESVFQRAQRLAIDRGFASIADYVSELVRRDETVGDPFPDCKADLEAMLIAGLQSSEATPLGQGDWAELRRRVIEVHNQPSAGP